MCDVGAANAQRVYGRTTAWTTWSTAPAEFSPALCAGVAAAAAGAAAATNAAATDAATGCCVSELEPGAMIASGAPWQEHIVMPTNFEVEHRY